LTDRGIFTIHALLAEAAEAYGSAVAVTDGPRRLTFGELRQAALATASVLREQGIGRGDRVGICLAKSIDQVVALLAVLLADAIIVPILPRLKVENIQHIVTDSGMRTVITDPARAAEVGQATPAASVLLVDELCRYPSPGVGPAELPQQAIGADLAGIIYSSGSTGRP
jgi:acyl-CoA synthetase (AMP-forming)/AMP-acid ligase II